ncbi:MAG: GAF domain-containing protein [Kineosporiaceae bacterium]
MTSTAGQQLASVERLRSLARYDLTAPGLRAELDVLSAGTARLLDVPTAMVAFVLDSAQYVGGSHGLRGWMAAAEGSPAEWAFCARVVTSGGVYVVEDAAAHPEHAGSPTVLLDGVRSYAGVPLRTGGGHLLGAHCVIDVRPRRFTPEEIGVLQGRADTALAILGRHRRPPVPLARTGG